MDNDPATELYRAVLMDHSRNPRHWGTLALASGCGEVTNRLCGDRAEVQVAYDAAERLQIGVGGEGCAICRASLSMMATLLVGKTKPEVVSLTRAFDALVAGEPATDALGDVGALAAVTAFPARQRCATLAWEALELALKDYSGDQAG